MNAYEQVTERIIAQLEAGVIPWRQSWNAPAGTGIPRNRFTGKPYRGANFLTLLCTPFASREWMTYKQAQEMGAQVRKGEKGTPIIFWSTFRAKDAAGEAGAGDVVEIPSADAGETGKVRGFLKTYTVFNVEQMDGLPGELPFESRPFDSIADADALAQGYLVNGGPTLAHGGDRAFYRRSADLVQMPQPETFISPAAYYATLFHEFAHSTGHESRLDRECVGNAKRTKDDYAGEELLAEFSAAFLCVECGISNADLETDAAAYIQNWLKVFKSDSRIAVFAAQRAQKVVDFMLGRIELSREVAA